MANPFNPSGGGPDKTSLPNMGSPFAQNPQQQTNPFMGSTGSNNASASPFAGAGFKNPFSGEHAGGGNPFGGGTAGGGIKGLIDSNNKLIQAINKLSTIFEKLVGRMGGAGGGVGGVGGFGGQGGMGGTGNPFAGGGDALTAAQLRRLSSGPIFPFAEAGRLAGNEAARGAFAPGFTQQEFADQQFGANDPARAQYAEAQRVGRHNLNQYQHVGSGAMSPNGNFNPFGRYRGGSDADFQAMLDQEGPLSGAEIQQRYEAFKYGQTQGGLSGLNNYAIKPAFRAAAAAGGVIMNVATAQDLPQMVSQIPYIGGILAAPYQALNTRIQTAASLEPLARLVAQQGGISQSTNFYKDFGNLFGQFKTLGLGPQEALNEALQMQEASGYAISQDPSAPFGGTGPTLADMVGAGYTGQTVGSLMRLGRSDRPMNFYKSIGNIFGYINNMGLGDQGAMEFIGALEGFQQFVPGMGYRTNDKVNQALTAQIANNTNRGFAGASAVAQAQRQMQGIAEYGSGLKGIFGGLAETLTTASYLSQYGGDIVAAKNAFERDAVVPANIKGRLIKEFGVDVANMAATSKFASADYENIGAGSFAQGTGFSVDKSNINLSEKLIDSQLKRGDDLYTNRQKEADLLIKLNDKIEKALVDGIQVKGMEELVDVMIALSASLRALLSGAGGGLQAIINILRTLGIPI